MKKIKDKRTKNITLVAVVITIIVLLILAGVGLSLVLGEKGITQKDVNTTTGGTTSSQTAGFGAVNDTYKGDFGKKVSGYNAKAGTNWRLFYADSNFAYLICDRIGNTNHSLVDAELFPNFETEPATVSELGRNLNSKYTTNGNWELKTNGTDINDNIRAVAELLDIIKWTDYSTNSSNESIANWAIGAPTVEMFIASYNATHTIQLDSTVKSSTSTGYEVNKDGGGYSTYVRGLENTSNLDEAIYCNGSYSWWLASPSASSYDYVWYVGRRNDRENLNSYTYGINNGIRPIVSVPISKLGNEIAITNSY